MRGGERAERGRRGISKLGDESNLNVWYPCMKMSEEKLDHQFFKDRRCLKAKVSINKLMKIKCP